MTSVIARTFARHWRQLTLLLLGAIVVGLMAPPLAQPDPADAYFDDFFYYLVPAQRFLETGRFYLHPAVATNGFQPLWMGVVVTLLSAAHGHMLVFFALLNAAISLSFVLAAQQAMRLAREAGAGAVLEIASGLFVAAIQLQIATTGMEVALTTPLLLWLTRRVLSGPMEGRTPRDLVAVGAIGSLVALSRLDAVVLLLPLAVVLAWRDRVTPKTVAWLAVGLGPLLFYFLFDRLLAGSFLPVSGAAKLLKGPGWPTSAPLARLVAEQWADPTAATVCVLFLVLALVEVVRHADGRRRAIVLAGMAGVVLYYATYCVWTDWPLWYWYKYPYAWVAALACVALAVRLEQDAAKVHAWAAFGAASLVAVMSLRLMMARTHPYWVFRTARAIAAFAREHPGSYAMGDCAGTPAYMMGEPVLQTEGLLGDVPLLDRIRRGEPLRQVLDAFHIDYYVTLDVYPSKDSCFDLREPRQAGQASPVMRGHVCAPPLLTYVDPYPVYVFRVRDIE